MNCYYSIYKLVSTNQKKARSLSDVEMPGFLHLFILFLIRQ
jgi:hypothetical protein